MRSVYGIRGGERYCGSSCTRGPPRLCAVGGDVDVRGIEKVGCVLDVGILVLHSALRSRP